MQYQPAPLTVHVGTAWPTPAPRLIRFDGKICTHKKTHPNPVQGQVGTYEVYDLPIGYFGRHPGVVVLSDGGVVVQIMYRLQGVQGLRSGNRRYQARRP